MLSRCRRSPPPRRSRRPRWSPRSAPGPGPERPAERHPAGPCLQAGDHDGDRTARLTVARCQAEQVRRSERRSSRGPIRTSKQGSRSASAAAISARRDAPARCPVASARVAGEGPVPPQLTSHVGAGHQLAGRLGPTTAAADARRSGRPAEHDEPSGLQARHPARQRVFAAAVRRPAARPAAVDPQRFHDAVAWCASHAQRLSRGRSLTALQPGGQHGRLPDPARTDQHRSRRRAPASHRRHAAAPGRAADAHHSAG